MMLIADCGGTKTDWRFISVDGSIHQYSTDGYNAMTNDIPRLIDNIKVIKHLKPQRIYLYIAGLQSASIKKEIIDLFENSFELLEKVEVHNDLLGAARSLYTEGEGAVGILGTGSAGFRYQSNQIAGRVPSLGYLLGNEGSGYDLGKCFIKGLIRQDFSPETISRFKKDNQWYSEEEILRRLYANPNPSFLAQFAESISSNLIDPKVWNMVDQRFKDYLKVFFLKERKPKIIRFSGSVAFHFQDLLLDACRDLDLFCDRIIESPIAGLTLYHQKHG